MANQRRKHAIAFAFTTTDLERGSSKVKKRTMRSAVSLSFHCKWETNFEGLGIAHVDQTS